MGYSVRSVKAKRSLLGLVAAVILAVAALLLPGVAEAHAGHHGSGPSLTGAPVFHAPMMPMFDAADADVDGDAPSYVFLSNADLPGSSALGACHAPCCCISGGMGCASPVLGLVSIPSLPRAFGHAAFEATDTAFLADALSQRLRKPPRG